MVRIFVDDKEIFVDEKKSLLQGCLDNDIYIPNLCFLEDMDDPPGSCRMCFVEIEGMSQPVISCKIEPKADMVVRTATEEVIRLQRTSLRLLLSIHEAKCKACPSNKKCILQQLVRRLGVRIRPRRYDHLTRSVVEDSPHPFLKIVHSRCILCGRCIHECRKQNGNALLTFARRGIDTIVTTYGEEEEMWLTCDPCLACIEACPVSAILLKDALSEETLSEDETVQAAEYQKQPAEGDGDVRQVENSTAHDSKVKRHEIHRISAEGDAIEQVAESASTDEAQAQCGHRMHRRR